MEREDAEGGGGADGEASVDACVFWWIEGLEEGSYPVHRGLRRMQMKWIFVGREPVCGEGGKVRCG